MLAFENQMSDDERHLFVMGIPFDVARNIVAIAEEYEKPGHGKWDNNT